MCVCFGRQPSLRVSSDANPVPILQKGRRGHNSHETSRISSDFKAISQILRNRFVITAKRLTKMRATPRPRPSLPRPTGSPPRLARPHQPCRFLKTRQRFAGMGHGVFQKTAARLRPHPRISIFGHAYVERNHVVSLRRGRRDCERPCRGQPKNLGKNRPTHAELPVRGLGAAAESFGGGAHMPPPAKNRVGFRGHTRGRKPVGLCGRSVRSSPPPPGLSDSPRPSRGCLLGQQEAGLTMPRPPEREPGLLLR